MGKDSTEPEKQHLDSSSTGPAAPDWAQRVHRHLVAVCGTCGEAWRSLSRILRRAYRQVLDETVPPAAPPRIAKEDVAADPSDIQALEARAAELSRLRRHARQQMSELRNTPRHRRVGKVKGATRRFRSGLLAELLIDEARERVRNEPSEAESFAALVAYVLTWPPGKEEPPWSTLLLARGAAHRANALRVAGDLPAADKAFRDLHRNLAHRPVADPRTLGEIASLEASLRTDQRRLDEAEELLRHADLSYRYAGDPDGRARTLIQLANLAADVGQPKRTLGFLAAFEKLDEAAKKPYRSSAVVAQVAALCDLKRATEARRVLHADPAVFEGTDPRTDASVRTLEGRILLLKGEAEEAEEQFRAAIFLLWELGRAYDAALASLDLARTLLALDRTAELRRLATHLAAEFRQRQVVPEAAEAVRLLQHAAETESVTVTLLAQIQRRLLHGPVPAPGTG